MFLVIQNAHLLILGYTGKEKEEAVYRYRGSNYLAPSRSLHSLEDTMEERRWLLPFTHGVDMRAIDTVVRVAQAAGATLVVASLISVPDVRRSRGVRLEHIQQSKDFLEAVRFKAARYRMRVEPYEVFTPDVLQSITLLTHDQHCDSIVLLTSEHKDVLLPAHEVKHVLEAPPASLVVLRLPARAKRTERLGTGFLSWLHRLWRQQDTIGEEQDTSDALELSWIRTEAHHWR